MMPACESVSPRSACIAGVSSPTMILSMKAKTYATQTNPSAYQAYAGLG